MGSKATSRGKANAASACIVLPGDCRLAGLDELVPQLRAAAGGEPAQLDACAVERVDSAVLQLLVAFRRAAVAAGGAVTWLGASETLHEAANLLGLSNELDLPARQPA